MYEINQHDFIVNVIMVLGAVLLFLDVVFGDLQYVFYNKYFSGFVGGAGIGLVMAGVAFYNV